MTKKEIIEALAIAIPPSGAVGILGLILLSIAAWVTGGFLAFIVALGFSFIVIAFCMAVFADL
jgi:hypothetical protein